MRIAQVAPLFESVPPTMYGGTERVVSNLTEELVRQGHEVTLFASGDSETSARLVAGSPRALWREPGCRDSLPHHVRLVELVAREADRFDVIHFHLDYVHFPALDRLPCPTVTTLHGRLYPPDELALFDVYFQAPLVSISDAQRLPVPRANWQATVYHGMPLNVHTFREGPGSYLAFLGRVSPEKGLDKAVEIAGQSMVTDLSSTFDESADCMTIVGSEMSRTAARAAYEEAQVAPHEVDVCELHDCFSANELITYEALGFAAEGEAHKLVEAEATTFGGQVVVNPSGGLISKGHPLGATGLAQCSELTWQLRGEAGKRQVEGARVALQHNIGLGGAAVVTVYKPVD